MTYYVSSGTLNSTNSTHSELLNSFWVQVNNYAFIYPSVVDYFSPV